MPPRIEDCLDELLWHGFYRGGVRRGESGLAERDRGLVRVKILATVRAHLQMPLEHFAFRASEFAVKILDDEFLGFGAANHAG